MKLIIKHTLRLWNRITLYIQYELYIHAYLYEYMANILKEENTKFDRFFPNVPLGTNKKCMKPCQLQIVIHSK